jgi:hypothetical protein
LADALGFAAVWCHHIKLRRVVFFALLFALGHEGNAVTLR